MISAAIGDKGQQASRRLPMVDLAWLWIAGFFGMLGGATTLAVLELSDERLFRALRLPLYPGFAVAARMDAEHHLVRTLLVGTLVNALIYVAVIVGLRLLWRALQHPRQLSI